MPPFACVIEILPALSDNYIYLLRWPQQGVAVVVDPGEAGPVVARLAETGEKLTHILNTHHHGDHIGGNAALAKQFGAQLIAPASEAHRIAGINQPIKGGDQFTLHDVLFEVIETPGHTSGHIVFHLPTQKALFSGDTLFALGCGRLLEGTPAQMWQALQTLAALPDDTLVYCGHEYTQANWRFAMSLEAANADLVARGQAIAALRANGQPTVPSRLGDEKATNPFLRAGDLAEFTRRRAAKDSFR